MGLVDEIRQRARHVVGPLFGIVVVGYFAYHTVHGDRGVMALIQTRERVEATSQRLLDLQRERDMWEQRVALLHPESLDPDMLDERVRLMLGYASAEDVIILLQSEN